MVTRLDIFNINFYKKEAFHGSYGKMHYRIKKAELPASDENEKPELKLEVATWPGPYNFATTADEDKTFQFFPYTNDALNEIADYLNELHDRHYQ